MHQCIRLIVYADKEEEAGECAEKILFRLCGDYLPFDYGEILEKNNHWNVPSICLANSKEGKKLLDDGMRYYKNNFLDALKKVRVCLENYSDEEIFEEKPKQDLRQEIIDKLEGGSTRNCLWKYYFYQVGKYAGSDIFVYDFEGEGIRDSEHLKDALYKWNEGKTVWVVCCDVHF